MHQDIMQYANLYYAEYYADIYIMQSTANFSIVCTQLKLY